MSDSKNKSQRVKRDNSEVEYDSQKGEHPHYAKRFPEGAVITIHGSNGRTTKKQLVKKTVVILESDVSKIFPDTKSVNAALRHLIAAVPQKRKTA